MHNSVECRDFFIIHSFFKLYGFRSLTSYDSLFTIELDKVSLVCEHAPYIFVINMSDAAKQSGICLILLSYNPYLS